MTGVDQSQVSFVNRSLVQFTGSDLRAHKHGCVPAEVTVEEEGLEEAATIHFSPLKSRQNIAELRTSQAVFLCHISLF